MMQVRSPSELQLDCQSDTIWIKTCIVDPPSLPPIINWTSKIPLDLESRLINPRNLQKEACKESIDQVAQQKTRITKAIIVTFCRRWQGIKIDESTVDFRRITFQSSGKIMHSSKPSKIDGEDAFPKTPVVLYNPCQDAALMKRAKMRNHIQNPHLPFSNFFFNSSISL